MKTNPEIEITNLAADYLAARADAAEKSAHFRSAFGSLLTEFQPESAKTELRAARTAADAAEEKLRAAVEVALKSHRVSTVRRWCGEAAGINSIGDEMNLAARSRA
jgi:hypothetical protein